MGDARIYHDTNPNLWIGTPRTAANVLPVTIIAYGSPPTAAAEGQMTPVGIGIGRVRVRNCAINVVTTATAGLGMLLPDASWLAGLWTNATTTYADDTADAQSAAVDDFAIGSTTVNDGFLVGCSIPFNMVTVDVTTAATGTPAYDYGYWGQPTTGIIGTAGWQTVTPVISPTWTTTGEKLIVYPVPFRLMATTTTASFTGARSGYYWLRCRATTAATAAANAARVYAGRTIFWQSTVAANSLVNLNSGGVGGRTIDGGQGLQAFFGTAAANNMLYLELD